MPVSIRVQSIANIRVQVKIRGQGKYFYLSFILSCLFLFYFILKAPYFKQEICLYQALIWGLLAFIQVNALSPSTTWTGHAIRNTAIYNGLVQRSHAKYPELSANVWQDCDVSASLPLHHVNLCHSSPQGMPKHKSSALLSANSIIQVSPPLRSNKVRLANKYLSHCPPPFVVHSTFTPRHHPSNLSPSRITKSSTALITHSFGPPDIQNGGLDLPFVLRAAIRAARADMESRSAPRSAGSSLFHHIRPPQGG